MKKIVLLFLFFSSVVLSQTRGISYQALIIDPVTQELPGVNNSNAPLANKDICLKFSIIDEINVLEYEEIFSVRTDNYGMVNLIIGTEVRTGGYALSFEDIQWSLLPKNLKIDLSTDISCTTFTEISNSPFTAVPFALFAVNTVDNPLILDNQREIALLRALIRATQIGAGLDADGGYTPEATTFFINSVTSLKEADIVLDNQVKINENNINTNTGSITTNTSNITTNTININNNTTDIATNETDIAVNNTNITTNVTNIATNVTDIVTNTTDIAANNLNIATNSTNITNNTTDIITNETDIAINATNIANNTTDIATKVNITDIVNDLITGGTTVPLSAEQGKVLKGLIDSSVNIIVEDVLTSSSTINALSANQGKVLKGFTDNNATDISMNITNIATNAANIVSNDTDIAANTTNITNNTNEIATNVADIATNAANIASNDTDIAANTTNITNNTNDIATNVADIATNAANIASNDTDIAANTTNITTNTAGIATNTTNITKNTNDISNINNLANGKIYLGDINDNAQEVTLTGDITMTNAGATAITNIAVTNAKLDKTNIPLSGFGAAAADVALGAKKLTDVADPTAAQDAATKNYVDSAIQAGEAATVTSISDHIQSSSNNTNAATSGSEYSATASIASGSRTFDSSNATNTYNAGIDINSNSIVTITLTSKAYNDSAFQDYDIQPVVTSIDATNNTFIITSYVLGVVYAPNHDFTFNFLIIK